MSVEPTIDFTYETEINNTLTFLNILLRNGNNELEFKVHHQSAKKNDHLQFYS